ncbi:unnamed protein product [Penicillium pancosmium]
MQGQRPWLDRGVYVCLNACLFHCPLYTSLRTTMSNKIWYKTDLGRTTDYNRIVSDSQAIRYAKYEDVDANIETLEGSGQLEAKTLRMQNTVSWRLPEVVRRSYYPIEARLQKEPGRN